jgi:anti-sigma B factor antagonist
VTVIEFRDRRLIDAVHIEKLGKQILDLIAKQRTPRVVLSFKSVEFLSSTALNALIQIENAIRQKKGQLRLADLDAQLQKVFTMMKLQKVMPIVDSTEEAVKSLDS